MQDPIINHQKKDTLETPALILDVDILENNIRWMACHAKKKKRLLRPHCKGHKSTKIAQLQMKEGAAGISAATIGEAEVMVNAEIPGVLITSPIATPSKIARLIALNQKAQNLMVVVDNLQNIESLSFSNKNHKPLKVLIDFDVGQNRTGAKSIEEAVSLARAIKKHETLNLVGMQAYGGHVQHVADYHERERLVRQQNKKIKAVRTLLEPFCADSFMTTGGGTGTFDIDLHEEVFSEIQVGSYIFMDVQYENVQLLKEQPNPFAPSLFVLASVISTHPHFAIVDAGLKAFATDGPKPRIVSKNFSEASYQFMGDEHGKIVFEKDHPVVLGQQIEFLTPHCDPTVNLYNFYVCCRNGCFVENWPIEARGLH